MTASPSFNPSVGILGVQARLSTIMAGVAVPFQSLGRDSGCSSPPPDLGCKQGRGFQSLGRDSGCSSRSAALASSSLLHVSIPRSGFWVFKRPVRLLRAHGRRRFNPSVGILGVQARTWPRSTPAPAAFQSLGRDSGCSSVHVQWREIPQAHVSIPRSGFWVFKLAWQRRSAARAAAGVSIPRSGFWVFKLQLPPSQR